MAIDTITQAIVRGNISIYLSANDNAKGNLFGGRKAAPGSSVSIALITSALTWGYSGGAQTVQDLRSMANYLIWLIGMYGQQAQVISEGTGGGSVIPIPPGGAVPGFYDFVVTSSSFIVIGETSKQFPSEWIGFNIIFFRSHVPQSIVNEGSTYYEWNPDTAILTLKGPPPDNGAAVDAESFQIYPA